MIYNMYPTFWSQVNVNWRKQCKHSVMGGDPTSVVFSAPLHGGSPDEWVTEPRELRDHGQVGWTPRLVDGEESRPCNHIYISRKPRPVGEELHFQGSSFPQLDG
jgi:hypothetical protein